MFKRHIVTSLMAVLIFTVITGVVYPLVVTGIAQIAFPNQANGSLVRKGGKILGSELIGQPFTGAGYFWSRPSPTSPYPYNAGSSSGSNYGPANPALLDEAAGRIADLRKADTANVLPIPVDLVTSSSSGLDPDITIAAALYQVPRVARSRAMGEEHVRAMVEAAARGRTFGILGEARVNVLALNMALDEGAVHPGGN